jgi:DNA-3-methyladenine glycosylase II
MRYTDFPVVSLGHFERFYLFPPFTSFRDAMRYVVMRRLCGKFVKDVKFECSKRGRNIPKGRAILYTKGAAVLFFQYGKREIDYLKSRDKILGNAIDKIGHIERTIDTDLFSSIVHHIIGQQISTAAQKTIWERMNNELGAITVDVLGNLSVEKIQNFGMTFRKAEYIKDFSHKIECGTLNIGELKNKSDNEIIKELSKLKGIGQWTAEMIMIFCLQRSDILSCNDLAIQRGLRMLYHHRDINKNIFEKYRRRYSPYCTVASLYLWSIAAGTIEGMKDYAPKKKESIK